ncbi:SDR family oxidoreductase [Ferrovibrio sp.]|uniref:SDR family oxidoreductase n=1 Tax=Ferrovibrio sp. TaxID=1917215 RepID=UPI0035B28353
MPEKLALVAGARGIVGGNLVDRLLQQGWRVIGVSRGDGGPTRPNYQHIGCDLLNPAACAAIAPELRSVSHVFYTARASAPEPAAEIAANLGMLRIVMEQLLSQADGLRHVCLVHGTKWYGSHLGAFRTPAREEDPRHAGSNWYFDQHDFITAYQKGKAWTWSTVRPHIVFGIAVGYPFNLVATLAAYASLCRESGAALDFPGSARAYNALSQATDTNLLADAMIWSAQSSEAANQDFNVINGDYFRWCNLWPSLADSFGLRCGEPVSRRMSELMADSDNRWDALVSRHGLASVRLDMLANWHFADFLFKTEWDALSSTVKIRQAGFDRPLATEKSMLDIIAEMRCRKLIPS